MIIETTENYFKEGEKLLDEDLVNAWRERDVNSTLILITQILRLMRVK